MKNCLLVIFSFSFVFCHAQRKSLKAGDNMPDYTFINLINYPTKTEKLSHFSGKLVILDFWSTSCATCVASWPHLMELQKKFKNEIRIILINRSQDKETVQKAIDQQYRLRNFKLDLPCVCVDSVLGMQLFPHQSVPHVVWVGKDGIVKSITYSQTLTEQNIENYLKTGAVNFPQKDDYRKMRDMDWGAPYFYNGNGKGERLYWQSLLAKSSDMPVTQIKHFNDLDGYQISTANVPTDVLYRIAYCENLTDPWRSRLPAANVRWLVKDSSKYFASKITNPDWLFVYQLYAPPFSLVTPLEMQRRMQQDLDFAFKLNVEWKKQKTKCLVLKAEDTTLISYKSGKQSILHGGRATNYKYYINKCTVSDLIAQRLQMMSDKYPIVDETGMKGQLGGIELDEMNIESYEDFNKRIKKYKMSYTVEEREVNLLIIKEPKDYKFPFGNTPLPGLDKPEHVSIKQPMNGWVELTLDPIPNAASYRLEYKKAGDEEWKIINFTSPKLTRLINDSDESYGYIFRVAGIGVNNSKESLNYYNTDGLLYSDEITLTLGDLPD